jgi:hypothetical protein
MPYIPPHLRPGYIPSKPVVKPDLTGRVHWPTDKNKDTNILESSKVHEPHLGIMAAKSAVKLGKPITMNSEPLAKPRMHLGHSKFNQAVKRHLSKKFKSKKRVSRRRSMTHRKKTKTLTYKRKTY